MRADEVLAFQKFSQSLKTDKKYGKKDSPWHEENDPELWMWKKTCLKQLTKTLPLNDNLARAVEDDDVEGDIKEYQKQQLIEQGKKDDGFRINQLLEGKKETEDEKFDREFDEGLKESTDPITGEICTK